MNVPTTPYTTHPTIPVAHLALRSTSPSIARAPSRHTMFSLPRRIAAPFRSFFAAVLLLALMSGCSLLDPGPAPVMLQINPQLPAPLASSAAKSGQLIVAMPTAVHDIDTDKIVLIFNDREVRHLADTRWAGVPTRMFQQILVDALHTSGAFKGVADDSLGLHANAKLVSELRLFDLRYASETDTPTAEFSITLRLLDLSKGSIVAVKTFQTSAPAGGSKPVDLAQACEVAVSNALKEITPWVAMNAKGIK